MVNGRRVESIFTHTIQLLPRVTPGHRNRVGVETANTRRELTGRKAFGSVGMQESKPPPRSTVL